MTDAARRLRRLVWRTRARTAVLVAAPFLAFAGLLFAVVGGPVLHLPPETGTLSAEQVVLDETGNQGLWMIRLQNGRTVSAAPHRSFPFGTGREVCLQRNRVEWLGLEKARVLHDGPCP